MSASRRVYEQRMIQRRDQEQTNQNLESYVKSHTTMKANASSEPKIEAMRRAKMQAAIRSDIRADAEMMQADSDARASALAREQEEKLAGAIDEVKRAELRKEKDIQRIREESEELRALEAKLKAAYMNKEREAQHAERKAREQALRQEEAQWDTSMEADRISAVAAMQEKEAARRKHASNARIYLDEQIKEKESLKSASAAEFVEEKALIDGIVGKIRQQDEDEEQARRAKRMETQIYIKQFIKEKDEERQQKLSDMEREESIIEKYAEEKRQQMDAWEAGKQAAQFERDRIAEQIAEQQRARLKEQEYMENLRNDLVIEEREEAMRIKEKEQYERRIQERLDMMKANEEQQVLKQARAAALQEEEETFREQMLAKFAEDDRIEQMNAQKRRMKQADHRREVERLIEARRAEFEAQKAAELIEGQDGGVLGEAKRKIIEEERQKMIAEHAAKLYGYLPPGTLLSEQDLEYFPPELREEVKAGLANGDWNEGRKAKHGLRQTIQSYTIF
jgi:hypothetical protein|eukprot:COSAG06_NODE_147_length_22091_cov_70.669880_13_plen_509_part_00